MEARGKVVALQNNDRGSKYFVSAWTGKNSGYKFEGPGDHGHPGRNGGATNAGPRQGRDQPRGTEIPVADLGLEFSLPEQEYTSLTCINRGSGAGRGRFGRQR
jgi:hypothetical protein